MKDTKKHTYTFFIFILFFFFSLRLFFEKKLLFGWTDTTLAAHATYTSNRRP
jgi:hypothetical protein